MTQIFIPRICPRKMKTYSQKNLYTNVQSSFIHKIRRTGKRRRDWTNHGIIQQNTTQQKGKKRRYNKTLWIASSILSFWYLLKRNQPKEAFPGYPNLMSLLPITLQHLTFCYDLKIHHYMNYLFGLCCITPLKCKLHEGKEPCLVQPTECLQWKRNSNIYPINEWTTCNKSDRS